VALSLLSAVAVAAPKHKAKAKAVPCTICKMPLSSKKDNMHTIKVKVKGKTMWCCAACGMKPSK